MITAKQLITQATVGSPEEVKRLIALGADVNAQAIYGATPLHHAASRDDVTIGKILLERGANPALECNGQPVRGRSAEFRALLARRKTNR